MKLALIKHLPNQHGHGVSIVARDEDGKVAEGFVLHSCASEQEQTEYVAALVRMTGFKVEDHTPVPVNLPFERIPQHASDPGFGPVPPEPPKTNIVRLGERIPREQ